MLLGGRGVLSRKTQLGGWKILPACPWPPGGHEDDLRAWSYLVLRWVMDQAGRQSWCHLCLPPTPLLWLGAQYGRGSIPCPRRNRGAGHVGSFPILSRGNGLKAAIRAALGELQCLRLQRPPRSARDHVQALVWSLESSESRLSAASCPAVQTSPERTGRLSASQQGWLRLVFHSAGHGSQAPPLCPITAQHVKSKEDSRVGGCVYNM